jgi:hypothetical protein
MDALERQHQAIAPRVFADYVQKHSGWAVALTCRRNIPAVIGGYDTWGLQEVDTTPCLSGIRYITITGTGDSGFTVDKTDGTFDSDIAVLPTPRPEGQPANYHIDITTKNDERVYATVSGSASSAWHLTANDALYYEVGRKVAIAVFTLESVDENRVVADPPFNWGYITQSMSYKS